MKAKTKANQRILAALFLPLVLAACEDPRAKQISKIKDDEETIHKASAVVNEVIRNQADCDTAKPLIPEAYKRIEEAQKVVTAPASAATLGALKSQVDKVAQVCP